jgi:murein DD-endopeptidase MepM/ murein hydrolase activator NlpD
VKALGLRRRAPVIVLLLSALSSLGVADAVAWTSGSAAAGSFSRPPGPCPSPTPDPGPSPTPDPSPSPSPDPSPSPISDPSPSPTPDPSPSPAPDPSPSSTPEPSPSPSPGPTPSPTPDPSPSHSPTPCPSPTEDPRPSPSPPPSPPPSPHPSPPPVPSLSPSPDPNPSQAPEVPGGDLDYLYSGTFSTQKLVTAAEELRLDGWPEEMIRQQVFAPFIVVGPASWSDSWGAPRFGPGPILRRHEGQDVMCEYGADVLAAEDGIIEFDSGLLGGRVARLHRPGGGYWYYAHLAVWNLDAFSTGDTVHTGDVIGYCGSTGNATVPHVHFGHYGADGEAIDPMASLVSWLREAESDLDALLASNSSELAQITVAPVPIAQLPSFAQLAGGEADLPAPIETGRLATQGLVGTGGDGALELTLIWVGAIGGAWVSRLCGRLVTRTKRPRTS